MGWLGGLASGIVGGVAGAFGAKADRGFNKAEGKKQRKWNSREAEKNRSFQMKMRNTSVQARTKDLRKAGFNPLLAVTTGQGAAQPGGATAASYARAQSDEQGRLAAGVADQATRGISTAIQSSMAKQQIKNMKAEELKIHMNKSLMSEQALQAKRTAEKTITEDKLLRNLLPGSAAERKIDESPAGNVMRWTNRLTNTALGAVRTGITGKRTGN